VVSFFYGAAVAEWKQYSSTDRNLCDGRQV